MILSSHMLSIVLRWSWRLIVSQERCLASSAAPAVETEMVLHAALPDTHMKDATALLKQACPGAFLLQTDGSWWIFRSDWQSVLQTSCTSSITIECMFIFSSKVFISPLKITCGFLLLGKKRAFIFHTHGFHGCAPLPSKQENLQAAAWRQIFWLSAGSLHTFASLNKSRLYSKTLALGM